MTCMGGDGLLVEDHCFTTGFTTCMGCTDCVMPFMGHISLRVLVLDGLFLNSFITFVFTCWSQKEPG